MVPIFLNIILSIVGFAVLIKCADIFVDGAASFAKNIKISTAVIGLTIVAFGTSAPELAISFSSHISGNTDMMFGNVIGSNIANILFILGFALVIKPMKCHENLVKKELPLLMFVTMGVSVLLLDNLFNPAISNVLSRSDGIILLLFFAIFVFYLITLLRRDRNKNILVEKPRWKVSKSIIILLLGLGGIILGSDLVVNNVAAFAAAIGISQKVISVTVISIGTSLPELVTIITAARKGENSMAIGSIVGSNIFNLCIVLGLPIAILGDATTTAFNVVDAVFLLLSVSLLWVAASSGRLLRRQEGAVLIAAYAVYVGYILIF